MSKHLQKNLLINLIKIFLAAALVYWMVDSGKLDFSQLSILIEQPEIIAISFISWIIATILLPACRWWVLLRGIGLVVSYVRVLLLNAIGLFFNSTMPGAVGGDIIKAVYIVRDSESSQKTPAMLTILLDRLVGLMALFLIGAVAAVLNFTSFWENPVLRPLVIIILVLLTLTAVFFLIVFLPIHDDNDPLLRFVGLPWMGFGVLKKIYVALRTYRHRPSALIYALLLSILAQTYNMCYFVFLTTRVTGLDVDISKFAAIFPLGVFTTALPLAPGGLGVGHVAFEKLYELIGLTHGANVFNIFLLTNIVYNLIGVVPYILIKKKEPLAAL